MMSFTVRQIRFLRQNVRQEHIRVREAQGRRLSYIEGWHAIDQANRIFGFDGWDRETLEVKCALAREIRGQFTAVYIAKVRITVRAGDRVILREGQGTGEAQGETLGEAHDKALKTAETDATKRALATFGRPFGLGLYLGAAPGHLRGLNGSSAKPEPARKHQKMVEETPPTQPGSPDRKVKETAPEPAAAESTSVKHPSLQPAKEASLSMPRPGTRIPGVIRPLVAGTEPAGQTSPMQPSRNNNGPPRIDKSALTIGAPKRVRDKQHLVYVTIQPCLVCGRTPSDAHHLRFAQPRALSRKASDEFTVPLCRGHHRQLHHSGNEVDWWQVVDIDPLPIAEQLWQESRARKNAPLAPPGLRATCPSLQGAPEATRPLGGSKGSEP